MSRLGNREDRPYRLLVHSKDGARLQIWSYASIERLMEDAAVDLALGRNSPMRVLAPDESVLHDAPELLDLLRPMALRALSTIAARRKP